MLSPQAGGRDNSGEDKDCGTAARRCRGTASQGARCCRGSLGGSRVPTWSRVTHAWDRRTRSMAGDRWDKRDNRMDNDIHSLIPLHSLLLVLSVRMAHSAALVLSWTMVRPPAGRRHCNPPRRDANPMYASNP
jgi:hypothetical protein